MSDSLANFGCLDELTQVIYQGVYKFVVLSTVANDKWNIYLGLSGSEGRWWRGYWTEKDVQMIFGPKTSDKLLETFAENLAQAFIQGEICISDWSTEKGANIKFTLGPTSKKPMHVDLVEMTPEEAAAHATNVFIEIALQAQSRKCRLFPSSSDIQDVSIDLPPLPRSTSAVPSKRKEPSSELPARSEVRPTSTAGGSSNAKPVSKEAKAAEEEIKALKAQLQKAKQAVPAGSKTAAATTVPPSVRPHKGASLANPNKKARKYQAVQFGSDDEE
ncbi:hypothetical protein D9613_000343 [Agrocybe pediades]|uniref:Uncharacterized protein n=1 Tax=Agrocybe pediades TaxID=84607 RepID=A0A8H4R2E7_9AGAR|nr:hypothetical protein D9613_000343 [Agrocybe pediades]